MKDIEYDVYIKSLSESSPPTGISYPLIALWYAYKDNWSKAHHQVDHLSDQNSCWVHAYLHRWEGDEWNARYWYRQAKKSFPSYSLKQEWQELVEALTKK